MELSMVKLGVLGVLSLTAGSYAVRYFNKQLPAASASLQEQPSKPIQEIIKEVYMRISTKENLAYLKDLCLLNCDNREGLLQPYEYTLKTGGKKIRLIMAAIVAEMFIGSEIPKGVIQVGGLIEYLHSASLIIDDIEDGSLQRRGQACSHLVFGLDRAINAANLMYFLPFSRLLEEMESDEKKVQILRIFMQQMTVSHMGQAQDILVHKVQSSSQFPTIEQYQLLTIAKTSSLLRMMVKMLCVILNRSHSQSEQLCQAMNYIGLAFQVTDDVLNLSKNIGKGHLAEDLREKKFTPVVHALRMNQKFVAQFVKDVKGEEDVKVMLEIIGQSNALEETRKLAQAYEEKAEELIKKIQTPYSKTKFEKLMKFIITRQN